MKALLVFIMKQVRFKKKVITHWVSEMATQWFNEQAELIMSSTYKKGADGPQRLLNKSKLISEGNYRNNQKVESGSIMMLMETN